MRRYCSRNGINDLAQTGDADEDCRLMLNSNVGLRFHDEDTIPRYLDNSHICGRNFVLFMNFLKVDFLMTE